MTLKNARNMEAAHDLGTEQEIGVWNLTAMKESTAMERGAAMMDLSTQSRSTRRQNHRSRYLIAEMVAVSVSSKREFDGKKEVRREVCRWMRQR
jgi:hypothetical protein